MSGDNGEKASFDHRYSGWPPPEWETVDGKPTAAIRAKLDGLITTSEERAAVVRAKVLKPKKQAATE